MIDQINGKTVLNSVICNKIKSTRSFVESIIFCIVCARVSDFFEIWYTMTMWWTFKIRIKRKQCAITDSRKCSKLKAEHLLLTYFNQRWFSYQNFDYVMNFVNYIDRTRTKKSNHKVYTNNLYHFYDFGHTQTCDKAHAHAQTRATHIALEIKINWHQYGTIFKEHHFFESQRLCFTRKKTLQFQIQFRLVLKTKTAIWTHLLHRWIPSVHLASIWIYACVRLFTAWLDWWHCCLLLRYATLILDGCAYTVHSCLSFVLACYHRTVNKSHRPNKTLQRFAVSLNT